MRFFNNDHIQKLKLKKADGPAEAARDHGALTSLHPPRRQATKAKYPERAADFTEPEPDPTGWH